MDSVSLAYWLKPRHALTIDYGQAAAEAEVVAASQVAKELQIHHEVLNIDLSDLGLGRMRAQQQRPGAPSPEWWPFRNQTLITLAAAKAVVLGAETVLIGTLRTDGIHADGRPEFIESMASLLAFQEGNIRLLAPALELDAVSLAIRARTPASLLAWSHSCHAANLACGRCRGCVKHQETMRELGFSAS